VLGDIDTGDAIMAWTAPTDQGFDFRPAGRNRRALRKLPGAEGMILRGDPATVCRSKYTVTAEIENENPPNVPAMLSDPPKKRPRRSATQV